MTTCFAKVGLVLNLEGGPVTLFEGDYVKDLAYRVKDELYTLSGILRVIIASTKAQSVATSTYPPEPYVQKYIVPSMIIIDHSTTNEAKLTRIATKTIESVGSIVPMDDVVDTPEELIRDIISNDSEVSLGGDVVLNETLSIENKAVVLNLGNKKLTANTAVVIGPGASLDLEGGEFEGTITNQGTLVIKGVNFAGTITGNGTVTIYEGTYNFDPSAYVAEGYKAAKDEEAGVWIVSNNLILVDGKVFTNTAEAIGALEDGSTMNLETDVKLGGPVTLPANTNLTLLYNHNHITDGYNITLPGTSTLTADVVTNQFVAPEGYVINWEKNDANTWKYSSVPTTWPATITKADGSVKSYETAAAAFNASRDGDVVTLNEDISDAIKLHTLDTQGVSSGSVIVDLNGHTASNGASSCGGCTLTLRNGRVTSASGSAYSKILQAYGASGELIVEDSVTVTGISIPLYSAPGYNETTAEMTTNGGIFVNTTEGGNAIKIEKASGSSRANYGKITINGGSFTGTINVPEAGKESLIIRGGTFTVDPSDYLAEGCTCEQVGGKYVVTSVINGDSPVDDDI